MADLAELEAELVRRGVGVQAQYLDALVALADPCAQIVGVTELITPAWGYEHDVYDVLWALIHLTEAQRIAVAAAVVRDADAAQHAAGA